MGPRTQFNSSKFAKELKIEGSKSFTILTSTRLNLSNRLSGVDIFDETHLLKLKFQDVFKTYSAREKFLEFLIHLR